MQVVVTMYRTVDQCPQVAGGSEFGNCGSEMRSSMWRWRCVGGGDDHSKFVHKSWITLRLVTVVLQLVIRYEKG